MRSFPAFSIEFKQLVRGTPERALAASFGAVYGPPINPRWMYRCDFNNDRKIDIKHIAAVAKNFGKTSSV